MATLTPEGREILDQTPVSLPIHYDRPEPIHRRIRRMILEATMAQNEGEETLEDANDFLIPDDPSSFDTNYTEPDFDPVSQPAFTDAEIAAARAAIEQVRKQQTESKAPDAGSEGGVSSPPEAPAKPAE